jgi:hypothetical protein
MSEIASPSVSANAGHLSTILVQTAMTEAIDATSAQCSEKSHAATGDVYELREPVSDG